MSTSSIGSANSAYDYYTKGTQSEQTAAQRYGTSSSDTSFGADIRKKVAVLLEDIPRDANGKLTFEAVKEYRDNLLEEFEAKAKADLDKLGVDTERDMAFSYDAKTDTLTVDSNHPDKKIIDQYFTEQDDLRHQFGRVLALNKMTAASDSKLTQTELKTSMQVQSMAWWTEANAGDIFGGGNLLSAQSGQSAFFGVNLVV